MRFPSLRWPELQRVLERKPLRYRIVRQSGSHRTMESDAGYPPLLLAFHDRATVPPRVVRKVLVEKVGLPEDEAMRLL